MLYTFITICYRQNLGMKQFIFEKNNNADFKNILFSIENEIFTLSQGKTVKYTLKLGPWNKTDDISTL